MDTEDKKLAFIEAIIANDALLVKKFLEDGMDPNICLDQDKISPLHFAAQNNAVDVIPLLIAAGANVNATIEPEGQTPLDVAVLFQHERVIKLLSFYSDNPNATRH